MFSRHAVFDLPHFLFAFPDIWELLSLIPTSQSLFSWCWQIRCILLFLHYLWFFLASNVAFCQTRILDLSKFVKFNFFNSSTRISLKFFSTTYFIQFQYKNVYNKLGRCTSRRVLSVWKSLSRVLASGRKSFDPKYLYWFYR